MGEAHATLPYPTIKGRLKYKISLHFDETVFSDDLLCNNQINIQKVV
ncbi:hypothetical protein NEIMUCOT_04235 [Neisseria mucosa ATCC 25996]|uniref:Uncharacterized protein n=1 Tax=Neisseria mucosa (strain ATCC 25996 / DSM 4631 / NCTC 10774 / M26) TaxID=546266 RepID=D2ZUE7_NEIM2|nr:hypothetical protein [Neisseria mucosa]EFC89332.1 hypothetical protein NEIMUCOT_04235 [Neisseria mucosa ATCC 25996]MBS5835436.1 hypothetical protein [Neisseria sp.]